MRKLRLIDFDQVSLSSLNRHALATRADVGMPKAICLKASSLLCFFPQKMQKKACIRRLAEELLQIKGFRCQHADCLTTSWRDHHCRVQCLRMAELCHLMSPMQPQHPNPNVCQRTSYW